MGDLNAIKLKVPDLIDAVNIYYRIKFDLLRVGPKNRLYNPIWSDIENSLKAYSNAARLVYCPLVLKSLAVTDREDVLIKFAIIQSSEGGFFERGFLELDYSL